MESVVRMELDIPQARLAQLFADPRNNLKWMKDLERLEPLSGEPGEVGSVYRLIQKQGGRDFVVTVRSRNLPGEVTFLLDEPSVSVVVTGTFVQLTPRRTLFTSREVFRFKGIVRQIFGFFARAAIDQAHRDQMKAFRRFAEEQ